MERLGYDTESLNFEEITLTSLFTYDASKMDEKSNEDMYLSMYIVICELFISDNVLKKIPYDIIAKYVFSSNERYDEDNELLNFNLKKIVEVSDPENLSNINKFSDKVKGNYKLTKEQKQYIETNIDNINSEVESARNEVNDIVSVVNETQKKSNALIEHSTDLNEEMLKTKDKLLSEFVGILGIFSALIFGLFGGFEGLSTSLNLIANDTSLGKTIMTSSAVIICLISFLYAMIQWVGKLVDKPIKSCGCKGDDDCHSKHNFADRHSSFLLIIGIIGLLFLIGLLIMVGKTTGITNYITNFKGGLVLFVILVCLVIICSIILVLNIFKKNNS